MPITKQQLEMLFPDSVGVKLQKLKRGDFPNLPFWEWDTFKNSSSYHPRSKVSRAYGFLTTAQGAPMSDDEPKRINSYINDMFNRVHAVLPTSMGLVSYTQLPLVLRNLMQRDLAIRFEAYQYCNGDIDREGGWKAVKTLIELYANWKRPKRLTGGQRIKTEPKDATAASGSSSPVTNVSHDFDGDDEFFPGSAFTDDDDEVETTTFRTKRRPDASPEFPAAKRAKLDETDGNGKGRATVRVDTTAERIVLGHGLDLLNPLYAFTLFWGCSNLLSAHRRP